MATISEAGFGARLQNAKTILAVIEQLAKYQSSRPEDSIAEYQKLVESCEAANQQIAGTLQAYTMAVDKRSKAFHGKEKNALNKLLSPISRAIAGQYDKTSREYTSVMAIITKMRSQKLDKAPANPTEDKKDSISRSELSFGAMLQNFRDLVATIEVFQNFAPANPDITLDKLKAFAAELDALNKAVNTQIFPLSQTRSRRTELFSDLKQRTLRIKATISSLYGNTSAEYKQISGLKV